MIWENIKALWASLSQTEKNVYSFIVAFVCAMILFGFFA